MRFYFLRQDSRSHMIYKFINCLLNTCQSRETSFETWLSAQTDMCLCIFSNFLWLVLIRSLILSLLLHVVVHTRYYIKHKNIPYPIRKSTWNKWKRNHFHIRFGIRWPIDHIVVGYFIVVLEVFHVVCLFVCSIKVWIDGLHYIHVRDKGVIRAIRFRPKMGYFKMDKFSKKKRSNWQEKMLKCIWVSRVNIECVFWCNLQSLHRWIFTSSDVYFVYFCAHHFNV